MRSALSQAGLQARRVNRERKRAALLAALATGVNLKRAVVAVGISRRTASRYRAA